MARIERFTAGMTFDGFAANEQAVYASLHALLTISEAASKLAVEAETLVPSQPWADIRAIGNVLRHEYDGVDPHTVWRIIASGDLAVLTEAVNAAVARSRAGHDKIRQTKS
ncbi:MAG: HepT-like ribonuclease domain-containing protein [Acetobacteraceae bacterium]